MSESVSLTFEQKVEESKKILEQLNDPELTLEKSVQLYKQGLKELKEAQKILDDAKIVFEEINSSLSS
ncbi:MAG: exodeoxyribonuclease VII small subunit [Campylobacterales bacterium]|nr:exodeoxyribonuclease VII small subunit [Campylobacterales bacterium]